MKITDLQKKQLCNYLKDKPVKKAYIFGSYANGKADKDSDLDLLIELEESNSIGLQFFTMQHELEKLINIHIDLATPESISSYIWPKIDKEKVIVYEK